MLAYPPVRKIGVLTRSMGGRLVGGGRFESALERDFMTLMSWEQDVQRVSPQPVRIPVADRVAGRRNYTPDFLVEWRPVGGQSPLTELVEVKYREAFVGQWRAWRALARAASAYATVRGWRFRIVTEVEVRTTRLTNVRRLLPYRRRPADEAAKATLIARLRRYGPTSVELLVPPDEEPGQRRALLHALWHLVSTGVFCFNILEPLTPLSVISLGGAEHG